MSSFLISTVGGLYAIAAISEMYKGNNWIAGFLLTLSVLQFVQIKAFNL